MRLSQRLYDYFFNDENVYTLCGHRSKAIDKIHAFGESRLIDITPYYHGKSAYCHQCLSKMAIKCWWCKRPIFPFDMIELFEAEYEDMQLPEIPDTAFYQEKPSIVICHLGCLRKNKHKFLMRVKNLNNRLSTGFWLPPGQVSFLSPVEKEENWPEIQLSGLPESIKRC